MSRSKPRNASKYHTAAFRPISQLQTEVDRTTGKMPSALQQTNHRENQGEDGNHREETIENDDHKEETSENTKGRHHKGHRAFHRDSQRDAQRDLDSTREHKGMPKTGSHTDPNLEGTEDNLLKRSIPFPNEVNLAK